VSIRSTGAIVMGRKMFSGGEGPWSEFVTDGVEAAIEEARGAAGERNVAVAGGADVARQALRAGLVDELRLHVAPILLGGGVRLVDGLGPELRLELEGTTGSPAVTHVRYRVVRAPVAA
jgi:dihydrofolate reductase